MAEMTVPKQKQQRQLENALKVWLELSKMNWLELPSNVTANILYRIGVAEILENAQKVCTTWRKICKDPSMWRVIHMKKTISGRCAKMHEMCKHAADRSQDQLVDINIVDFDRL